MNELVGLFSLAGPAELKGGRKEGRLNYHRAVHLGKSGPADYYQVNLQKQLSIRAALHKIIHDTIHCTEKHITIGLLHSKYEYNTVHVYVTK